MATKKLHNKKKMVFRFMVHNLVIDLLAILLRMNLLFSEFLTTAEVSLGLIYNQK